MDGQTMGGQTMGGQTMGGQTMVGQTMVGQTMGGQTMNGQAIGGQSIVGHSIDGQTMDGQTMDNMVDDEGLDDSNIDLLPVSVGGSEKTNPSDEDSAMPSTTIIKHELQPMDRTISSDSDEQQYLKVKEGMGDDQYNMKVEAPVLQRKLFGPPCWNPEQLVAAIESVKNGTSVSASARKFGIPRTTLSNKIYGRRRKLYNTSESSTPYSCSMNNVGFKRNVQDTSLTYVIGSENERLVADIIAKQKHVDSFSMTRAIFDIVKYLAQDKGHVLKDDEEVKEWIQYFFMRYPSAYFPVTLFELRLAHADDEYFADFVFDTSKNEAAEEVLKKLMSVITRRLLVEKKVLVSIHLFWWYTFLTTYTDVRDYFLDNLTWPDTILNPANLQMVDDKGVHQILTCALLKRTHHGVLTSFSELKRGRLTTSDSSDSPTQVSARRTDAHSYENSTRPLLVNSYNYTPEDSTSQDSNNISSTSMKTTTSSLGKILAQEAIAAVERKISAEELRYFKFRYDNPRLDDAYHVWKNLKVAAEKEEEEHVDGSLM